MCKGRGERGQLFCRSHRELGGQGAGDTSDKVGIEDTPRPWKAFGACTRAMSKLLRSVHLKVHSQVSIGTRADEVTCGSFHPTFLAIRPEVKAGRMYLGCVSKQLSD